MTDVEFEIEQEIETADDDARERMNKVLTWGGLLGVAGWVVVGVLLWAIFTLK